jgi:hypothetical protein
VVGRGVGRRGKYEVFTTETCSWQSCGSVDATAVKLPDLVSILAAICVEQYSQLDE